ncbi:MAG: DUF2834 domain-containing protein [bacterium]
MKRKHLYLLLAIIGICWTWYYNIQYFQKVENASIADFIAQSATTLPAKSISADITVVCLTIFVWMIAEGLRLKMKVTWLLLPLTFVIAIAFTFPLFMYFREGNLETIKPH